MNDAAAPLRAVLEIVNEKGLHARASAKFATMADEFDARVLVSRDNLTVTGTSIMGLLLLAAAKGARIELRAEGPEAEQALSALSALVANRFDEPK